jgi:hypothetical protein
MYPDMNYDWTEITEQKILDSMKEGYILLKNTNYEYTDDSPDQYILIKDKSKL